MSCFNSMFQIQQSASTAGGLSVAHPVQPEPHQTSNNLAGHAGGRMMTDTVYSTLHCSVTKLRPVTVCQPLSSLCDGF